MKVTFGNVVLFILCVKASALRLSTSSDYHELPDSSNSGHSAAKAQLSFSNNQVVGPETPLRYDLPIIYFTRAQLEKLKTDLSQSFFKGSLHVALCVRGQARSFTNSVMHQAMKHYLVDDLRDSQGASVDTFFDLDMSDKGHEGLSQALSTFVPKFVKYNSSGRGYQQYSRLGDCKDMILEEEGRRKAKYDWVIQTRPDLLFSGPLPWLRSLKTDSIYSRMREFDFKYTTADEIPLDALSGEIHNGVWQGSHSCGSLSQGTSETCAAKRSYMKERSEFRMDDQFALIPRAQFHAYFECGSKTDLPDKRDPEIQKYVGREGMDGLCPCCLLTYHVLECGAKILPTALYFSLVRDVKEETVACSGNCGWKKEGPDRWLTRPT